MANNEIKILSTSALPQSLVQEAAMENISITAQAFINIEPVDSIEVQQEIETALLQSAYVIFTSQHAVEIIAAELDGHQPDWRIYCIANKTAKLVEKYFGKESIAGTAAYAEDLADKIIEDGEAEELIFFTGNKHLPTLMDKLDEEGLYVQEIIVYQNTPASVTVDGRFHGILFFSPSAAESFFAANKISRATVLFATGQTTANALQRISTNPVIMAEQTGKEEMIQTVMDYYR
ncbi:uroporphyrinogen-III synthase [Terrimonas rubra]|uniref:Uroporphyrinogen-III synthase n=1 Tax=Terrimonas rubra TaxID=1035890 RepID=A0ABW5ZZL5_9BACT